MALTNKCDKCKRQSNESDGWQEIHNYKTEPASVYHYCPNCWRMKSLKAQREMLIEAMEGIKLAHSDSSINAGMSTMKRYCIQLVKDFDFEA